MQSWQLDNLLSNEMDNVKLVEGLEFIKPCTTTSSLVAYDNFESEELQ
jgi:hypothetical protein